MTLTQELHISGQAASGQHLGALRRRRNRGSLGDVLPSAGQRSGQFWLTIEIEDFLEPDKEKNTFLSAAKDQGIN